ncbi:MAG: class I SAM-dependent methyltransferase [Candidatus Korarchaeota archaeon]|nr:class I SAM-dependent methyltransferase [Candidatus Korarchaeota archaeon]
MGKEEEKEKTPLAYRVVYSLGLRSVYRPVSELLSVVGPGAIGVDVGAGYGLSAELIADRVGHLILVEVDREMASSARRRLEDMPNVSVLRADARMLPLRDEVADFVIFFDSLHHIRGPMRALREAVRILKIGGVLGVYDFDDSRFPTRILRGVERMMGLHSTFLPLDHLVEGLTSLGMRVVGVRERWAGQIDLLAVKVDSVST